MILDRYHVHARDIATGSYAAIGSIAENFPSIADDENLSTFSDNFSTLTNTYPECTGAAPRISSGNE